jgi:hypothetical protein
MRGRCEYCLDEGDVHAPVKNNQQREVVALPDNTMMRNLG